MKGTIQQSIRGTSKGTKVSDQPRENQTSAEELQSGELSSLPAENQSEADAEEIRTESSPEPAERPDAAVSRKNLKRSLDLALAAARTAAENMGTDVVVLDMTRQTALFDYFVIATGTSRRQLHAISEEIDHTLEDDLGDQRLNREGYDESRWIVLDYGSIVVHLFDDETRAFYSLENLWADAVRVDISDLLKDVKAHQGGFGL